jgi:hypothetical protein
MSLPGSRGAELSRLPGSAQRLVAGFDPEARALGPDLDFEPGAGCGSA